jgi:SAM-dependent methyltransferase
VRKPANVRAAFFGFRNRVRDVACGVSTVLGMATHSHAGTPHTHDGIDWMARLSQLRKADEVDAPAAREVAERLVGRTPPGATVLDVGSGAGGMSVALVEAMSRHGGGRMVLVDATPELLESAGELASKTAAEHGDAVSVETHLVDLADRDSLARVPKARLLWAANVVHHLPDQQQTLADLAGLLVPGGCLALSEGGLPLRCLPWDIGVGEPGLHERLSAIQGAWFCKMRLDMPDAVAMPFGWNQALANVGLVGVTAFSYLIDRPAPATEPVLESVLNWLNWMRQIGDGQLTESDIDTVRRLLDENDPAYVGKREDVFLLTARTVHLGWAPDPQPS